MKKRFFALLMAAAMVFGLACCGNNEETPDGSNIPGHTHTYDESAWTYDENTHWHAATCEHFLERGSEAAHTMRDGTCEVCGYSVVGMTVEEFMAGHSEMARELARQSAGFGSSGAEAIASEFVWFATDGNNKLTDLTYIYTIRDTDETVYKVFVKTVSGTNRTDLKDVAQGRASIQGQNTVSMESSSYSYDRGEAEKYMPLADAVYNVYVERYGMERYEPLLRLVKVAYTADGECRIDVLDLLSAGYMRYLVKLSAAEGSAVDELIALVNSEDGIKDHADASLKAVEGVLVYQNNQG